VEKASPGAKTTNRHAGEGRRMRSSAERIRDGEDRCDRIAEGGKDLGYKLWDLDAREDNHDQVE
jgi:hypothetical protein